MEGKTTINDSVFVEIAREAMQKVEDVFRKEKKGALLGFTRAFTERFAPQITVKKTESTAVENSFGAVSLDVKISVLYGVNIPEVARKVREKIVSEIETLTGYSVEKVDITIEKIIKPEQAEENKEKADEEE
ncbi:MAG TPA: Asp23/Gls24 family envelope stress response protein [Thermoanaerobacterales bacterium]|nr:Asp23/Gls24 family envelope stress response protein [Thermoanaerobacterales bacterium]